MNSRVLVLDGNQRSALAVTRSLGAKGFHVTAADSCERSLSACSRYVSRRLVYPSPHDSPETFLSWMEESVARLGIEVVLPITDTTTGLLLKHREVVGDAALPFPDFETYDRLANKHRLVALAQSLSLPVPRTFVIRHAEERFSVYEHVQFPVVVKPAYSKVDLGGRWAAVGVKYAACVEELERIVAASPCLGIVPLLVQQRIVGHGHGVFALYDHGRPVVHFSHRRLREVPPSGGVSVLSESVRPNPVSRRIAQSLLSHVGWHGVAMVEFKVDPDGTPFLMEVNGRFWGSLQLAIDAGVDFPHLLVRLALGEELEEVTGYREGCRSRWLLGDLDHLYWVLKTDRHRYTLAQKAAAVREFLRLFDRGRKNDVTRLDDPRPFFRELANYFLPGAGKG